MKPPAGQRPRRESCDTNAGEADDSTPDGRCQGRHARRGTSRFYPVSDALWIELEPAHRTRICSVCGEAHPKLGGSGGTGMHVKDDTDIFRVRSYLRASSFPYL